MKNTIFLPKLIKVGLQKRSDTYTKKLGYIIYNDGKVWRKETSWEGWRDKKIKSLEFNNEPLDGFVLNKKAGGGSSGWNHRQTYCRVYDPRGFEFEITIPNLLYILENSTSIKGKGLEGKFVYGWEGKDLILIPEEAPEYKEMLAFTNLQECKVAKKDLILGGIYLDNQMRKVVFLEEAPSYSYDGIKSDGKKLWFYNLDRTYSQLLTIEMKNIKSYTGEIAQDYAELTEKLDKYDYYKPKKEQEIVFRDATIQELEKHYNWEERYTIENGKPKRVYLHKGYNYDVNPTGYYYWLTKSRRKGVPISKMFTTLSDLNQVYKLQKAVKQTKNVKETV